MSEEVEEPKAWNQLPRETSRAFAAFRCYLEQGPGRTFEEAYRRYRAKFELSAKKMSSAFRGWKDSNNWEARAAAFDREALGELDEVRADKQKEALLRVYSRADELVDAAINQALAGDGKMLRYFLDRIVPESPRRSNSLTVHAQNAQFNQTNEAAPDLSHLSFEQLINAIRVSKDAD